MLDLHTHLLPGIDDGPKTLDDALKLARAMVRDGVQHVVATPHIYPGVYDNTLATIDRAYRTMVQALDQAQVPLVLSMGAEVRLCAEMLDWLREGRLPFLGGMGPEHRTVLVELPDAQIPVGTERVLSLLVDRGVLPLLAHPERNRAVAEDVQRLRPFIEMGCKLQVTAASLLGEFGNRAEKAAQELLDLGWVEVIASDAHNLGGRRPRLGAAREWLIARLGQEAAEALTEHNPARLAGMGELMQLGPSGMLLRDLPPLQAGEAAKEAKAAAQPSAAGRSLLDALTDLPAPSDAGYPAATVTGTGAAGATQPGRLGEGAWAAPPHWPKAAARASQPKPDRTEDAGAHWRLSDFGDTAPLTTAESDEGLAPLEEWTLPLGSATRAEPAPATASTQAAAPKAEPQTSPKTAPKTTTAGTPPQGATRRTEETELAQQARRDRLATLARELREALPTEPLPLDQEAKAAQAAAAKPAAARAAEAAEAAEPATAAAPQAPAPAEPPTPQAAPAVDGTAASPQDSSAKGNPGKGRSWSLLRWWQRKPATRVEPQMQGEPEPATEAQVQAPAAAPAVAPAAAPMAKGAPLTPVMPTAPATASRPSADPVAPVAAGAERFASAPGMRPRGEPPELTDTVPAALVTPLLDASGDSPLRPAPLRRMPAPVGEITDVLARPLPRPAPAPAPASASASAPIAAPAPETTPASASVTAPAMPTAQAPVTPRTPAPADLPTTAKAQDRIAPAAAARVEAPAAAMPPPKAAAASPGVAPTTVTPTVAASTASPQAPAAARPNGSAGTNGLNEGAGRTAAGIGQAVSLRSLPDVEPPARPASQPSRRDEPAEARSRAFTPGRGSRASSGLARGDLASSFMPTVPDDFDDRPSWQAEAAIAAATEMAVGAQPRLTPPLHKSASGSGRPVGFRLSEITPVGYEPEPQRGSAMSAAQTRSR